MNTVTKIVTKIVVVLGLAVAAGVSHAAIDTTAAVTAISTDAGGAVTAIGGAMLGLAAVAIGFKWAKAAIFG